MSPAGRTVVSLLLRFALLQALFLAASVHFPLFEQLERPLVVVVDRLLQATAEVQEGPRLELRPGTEGWSYVLRVQDADETRRVERPFHPHAYVLALAASLVLATPGLGLRRRMLSLGVVTGLTFLLSVGLLTADAVGWRHSALGTEPRGLAGGVASGFAALHRTSGAGMLPILLWLLYASWLGTRRSEAEPGKPAGA